MCSTILFQFYFNSISTELKKNLKKKSVLLKNLWELRTLGEMNVLYFLIITNTNYALKTFNILSKLFTFNFIKYK